MSTEEFRSAWAALSPDERHFVRTVAAIGETAGSRAGNSLVAAYATERLRLLRLAAQALVTATWVAYLLTVLTVLRDTPTEVLTAAAFACAGTQAAWILRVERRLQRTIAANR